MRAELYRKHLYYKLYRALQDEGLSDNQMFFEDDICFVLPIGFFSFRFEHGEPLLDHFIVYKEYRSGLGNAIALYRAFRNILISQNIITFIATVMPGKLYFDKFIQYIARDNNMVPYAVQNGVKYYHVTCRR